MKNNQFLYLLINIGTILFPFIFSFDKKVYFKQYWNSYFKAILPIAGIFIVWDMIFTKFGVWGFNDFYHLPFTILGLPIEEVLFFITIPYACTFIYKSLKAYLDFKMHKLYNHMWLLLFVFSVVIIYLNFDKLYTSTTFFYSAILFLILYKKSNNNQPYYFWSYIISLLPFVLVNGVLTGMFTSEPVVWYNNIENLGIRFFTIPLDDFSYSFNLLVSVMLMVDFFENKKALPK